MKFQKICVLGLGYIGLPTASTFATHGLQVVGVDINKRVVEILRTGGLHIHEPGLRTLVQAAVGSGNLVIRDTPEPADAYIIAVPTPFYDDTGANQRASKRADMRAVSAASESIVPYLRAGNLVVLESTSPPMTTTDLVAPILERSGLHAGSDFHLAYSPERVLPGQILHELIANARVIGGIDRASAEAGRDLYATFVRGEIILTDATTAEMVKLMENTYRDVNIAIANEFACMAERFGVDVWQAIEIASLHPRVKILKPGAGVGGHCIGVDPWFLVEAAPDLATLIRAAREVNDGQPQRVVELIDRALGGAGVKPGSALNGRRVTVLGLAYKPDVDDLRESPAVEVIHALQRNGAVVTAYEPYKPEAQLPGVNSVATLQAALEKAELVALLVGHSQFRALNPDQLFALTRARIVVDVTNLWNAPGWQAAGFQVYRLGVGRYPDAAAIDNQVAA